MKNTRALTMKQGAVTEESREFKAGQRNGIKAAKMVLEMGLRGNEGFEKCFFMVDVPAFIQETDGGASDPSVVYGMGFSYGASDYFPEEETATPEPQPEPSAPAIEVVTECPACKESYNDALQFCPACEEIHPEHAARVAALCDGIEDPFEDELDAAPIALEECPELAPEDAIRIKHAARFGIDAAAALVLSDAEIEKHANRERAITLELSREVNYDRREVLQGLVSAAGGDVSNLYHTERGMTDAEAALLGYRGTGWEDDRNVERRAKEARKARKAPRTAELARTVTRRKDAGKDWAAEIDAQAVQVLEATTEAAYLVAADNTLVMAQPVAVEVPAIEAQTPEAEPIAQPEPRAGFFSRLKAKVTAFFSKPAPSPEVAPEPSPEAASIEAQPEPVAAPNSPEDWARTYAAELIAQHPDKAKKLAASLNFQLAQLATTPDADKWQKRAEAAFLAKVA